MRRFAVRSQAVVARFRELGIRLALGATPRDLLRMVLREGLRPVAVGLLIGLAGSWWFTRFVEPWLFATSSTDPAIIAGAAAVFGVAALVASFAPARRAAAVDPVSLLRLDT